MTRHIAGTVASAVYEAGQEWGELSLPTAATHTWALGSVFGTWGLPGGAKVPTYEVCVYGFYIMIRRSHDGVGQVPSMSHLVAFQSQLFEQGES